MKALSPDQHELLCYVHARQTIPDEECETISPEQSSACLDLLDRGLLFVGPCSVGRGGRLFVTGLGDLAKRVSAPDIARTFLA